MKEKWGPSRVLERYRKLSLGHMAQANQKRVRVRENNRKRRPETTSCCMNQKVGEKEKKETSVSGTVTGAGAMRKQKQVASAD